MPCKKGQILRKNYSRKSSSRSKSKKRIIVKATCIKDIGSKGHGKKILPKPNPANSLRKFGYKLEAPKLSRHKALLKASKKLGNLPILKRVNLIRNYVPKDYPLNKSKLSDDVEFLKKLYKKSKK